MPDEPAVSPACVVQSGYPLHDAPYGKILLIACYLFDLAVKDDKRVQ
jgi:hypothetical protein